MADQRITELVELSQGAVASGDVLPIVDISASQTKKVQVKSLIQAGFNLADSSTLDIAKINQASATKLSTAAIEDNSITYAKIQQVSATDKLLGRSSAGSGNIEEITCTSFARTILDDADASTVRTTLGLGVVATGNTIGTSLLEDASVISDKIASGSVTTVKIADSGVTNAKLAANAVDSVQLVASGVTQGKLAADSILAINIVNSGITGAKIAAATISGVHIVDGSITQVKLASGIVGTANIVDSGITQVKLAANAVETVNIANDSVTAAKIASGSVTLAKLSLSSGQLSGSLITASSIPSGSYISGSIPTEAIQDNAVTFAKIQQVASGVLLGRSSAGSGNVETITLTAAGRALLDDADAATQRTTLGLGTLATQNGTFSGTSTGTNTGDQTITLSGDVSGTGTGAFAATIASSAITTAKINDSAVTTVKIADSGITAIKLSDNSASINTSSAPTGSGAFIGQGWFNTNNGYSYNWDGSAWQRTTGLHTVVASGDAIYAFSTEYADAFSATIVPALNTQVASRFFAGPASGSADASPVFRAIEADDLPRATSSALGVAQAGTGLVAASGVFNHANSVASGTYYKVTVDGNGHVTTGVASLVEADIPSLSTGKITTGTFGSGLIADGAINASKLANYSVSAFGETLPEASYIGQFFFNPLEKDLFLWDGNVWNPVGISVGEIIFGGTYDANLNVLASLSADGSAVGLSEGQPLPSPSLTFNRYYVVVNSGGTGTSPAPTVALQPPDILLCNGTAWTEVDVSSTYTAQAAVNVAFTPAASLGSTNVQAALEEVSTECRNVDNVASGVLDEAFGGTGQSSYTKGDILVASGTTFLTKLGVGTDGQIIKADSSQVNGLVWYTPASGTVLSVSATSPIAVVSGTTTPVISIPDASTSVRGSIQLTDSTSTTSSSLAATATAVKSAYDLANAALPRAGGTITGAVVVGTTGSIQFEGSTDDTFETTLTVADPTADRTITLPNVNGTVITTGDTGTVTNTMLAGSIADTKLSTISTAGKVSNSATTATSANTASAIVARDGSGNFSAGTISATIDEGTF